MSKTSINKERVCNCGIVHISKSGKCNSCRAQQMRRSRMECKKNPVIKICSKCNNSFISNKPNRICNNCESKHNKERWIKYSKAINRNNKEVTQKVKNYQDLNRINNEKWLLEINNGEYKCKCEFKSNIKEAFDLHHTDPALKTSSPSQLIRRGNFKEVYFKEKLELICKTCHRKEHSKKDKNSLYSRLENYDILPICAVSGDKLEWCQLEFHHINPKDKKFSINSKIRNRKLSKDLFDEINKCVIVSATNHILIHKGKVHCPKPRHPLINTDKLFI